MLESRAERNKLRSVIMRATDNKVIGKEEAGFVVTLVERFREDIEKKVRQLHMIQGEIAQLKTNEQVIMNIIEHLMAAAERDKARQETLAKLKDAREVQEEKRAEHKKDKKE